MAAAVLDRVGAARPNLWFEAGLPGFPTARAFALETWGGDDSPFMLMSSLDVEGLRFVVVQPGVFFPDYRPEVDDVSAERLALGAGTNAADGDSTVLVILTLGDHPEDATANLLAPVVINRVTGHAAQVVLTAQPFDTRVALARR